MTSFLGIDTSNYTTSAACCRADGSGYNSSQLLTVKSGELGLRQNEALFQHIKNLPQRFAELREAGFLQDIAAVGASTQPRAVEGSYMPCFLAGASQGRILAETLGVPFYAFSHQQGHIAAVCWAAKKLELLDQPMLAWHLSGGTTELLLVVPENGNVRAARIGGTTDISAGQLIDRTGQLLGLPFPSGKQLDELSRQSEQTEVFRVKCENSSFSLSGVQNKVQQFHEKHGAAGETAAYALRCVSAAVYQATRQALEDYPGLPVVFSGGVASNSMLRQVMEPLSPIFSQPQYSTDNAMGVAVLAHRIAEG